MMFARSKRLCACGCQEDVSASTERRHLLGQGPRQIAAAMFNESRFLKNKPSRKNQGSLHVQNPKAGPSDTSSHSASVSTHVPLPAPAAPFFQPSPPSADFADPMEVDNTGPADELRNIRQSTRVTPRAKNIEQVRWRHRPPVVESSDSDSMSEEQGDMDDCTEESSGSESDGYSESQLYEDGGFLSAWELLGEEFEREAHSLGVPS
jgi:hypothetical protein